MFRGSVVVSASDYHQQDDTHPEKAAWAVLAIAATLPFDNGSGEHAVSKHQAKLACSACRLNSTKQHSTCNACMPEAVPNICRQALYLHLVRHAGTSSATLVMLIRHNQSPHKFLRLSLGLRLMMKQSWPRALYISRWSPSANLVSSYSPP